MAASKCMVDSNKHKQSTMDVATWKRSRGAIFLTEPEIISEFVERNGDISFGRNLCPRLNRARLGERCSLDLNAGYKTFEEKDLSKPEYIYCLLNWIVEWSRRSNCASLVSTQT
ncbi:unnamed protein product [Gongylonema pulchrum]|uniref:Ovule protein n=1 Tax=Gongylonema pulchrum TaxID=637853 RepID=A0A183DP98_9BILA|nr:unnamed protein product [Gongylonema pulchrum]